MYVIIKKLMSRFKVTLSAKASPPYLILGIKLPGILTPNAAKRPEGFYNETLQLTASKILRVLVASILNYPFRPLRAMLSVNCL
jgi:hypothetical protein